MTEAPTTHRNLLRLAALGLGIVFALFVAQAAVHSHDTGQNEAACQICQAGHVGPVVQAESLPAHALLIAVGYVEPFVAAFHSELFFHDSPSRAPPTA